MDAAKRRKTEAAATGAGGAHRHRQLYNQYAHYVQLLEKRVKNRADAEAVLLEAKAGLVDPPLAMRKPPLQPLPLPSQLPPPKPTPSPTSLGSAESAADYEITQPSPVLLRSSKRRIQRSLTQKLEFPPLAEGGPFVPPPPPPPLPPSTPLRSTQSSPPRSSARSRSSPRTHRGLLSSPELTMPKQSLPLVYSPAIKRTSTATPGSQGELTQPASLSPSAARASLVQYDDDAPSVVVIGAEAPPAAEVPLETVADDDAPIGFAMAHSQPRLVVWHASGRVYVYRLDRERKLEASGDLTPLSKVSMQFTLEDDGLVAVNAQTGWIAFYRINTTTLTLMNEFNMTPDDASTHDGMPANPRALNLFAPTATAERPRAPKGSMFDLTSSYNGDRLYAVAALESAVVSACFRRNPMSLLSCARLFIPLPPGAAVHSVSIATDQPDLAVIAVADSVFAWRVSLNTMVLNLRVTAPTPRSPPQPITVVRSWTPQPPELSRVLNDLAELPLLACLVAMPQAMMMLAVNANDADSVLRYDVAPGMTLSAVAATDRYVVATVGQECGEAISGVHAWELLTGKYIGRISASPSQNIVAHATQPWLSHASVARAVAQQLATVTVHAES